MNHHDDTLQRLPAPRRAAAAAALTFAALLLGACAPIVIGGAMVGGAMVATDRRTSGTQVEDQTIELKARSRVNEVLGDRGHVSVTSYNRVVLVTGEVPSASDKILAGHAVERVENVKSVVNELAISGNSSLASRSSDTVITGKVKTAFVEAKDLMVNSVKVVTERGTVYLMGRVTEREAGRAADLARAVGGVQKVVRVFEVLTEAELAALPPAANSAASAPASAPALPTMPPGEAAPRK